MRDEFVYLAKPQRVGWALAMLVREHKGEIRKYRKAGYRDVSVERFDELWSKSAGVILNGGAK